MKWMLEPRFEKLSVPIHHKDPVLLLGSCFTGNMGKHLERLFFKGLANPTGILFDPFSISRHLDFYLDTRTFEKEELVFFNGVYQHPDFHSDFSEVEEQEVLQRINGAVYSGHRFLLESRYLIITLGSAFAYRAKMENKWVANCHKFPTEHFDKVLLGTEEIVEALTRPLERIQQVNPNMQILFTVSPVRHIRDGVVANNRSKARLLEAVHRIQESMPGVSYFPAYEWVVDVLRDYRWYDLDLVHPNYAATQSVFELFCELCMDEWTQGRLPELNRLRTSMEHQPRFPQTAAHGQFLKDLERKKEEIKKEMPWILF